MPIFELEKELLFPPVRFAEKNGLLAVGGDLTLDRLVLAYKSGIFPWYNDTQPILWWSPHPRFVLYPERLKISESMRRIIKSGVFTVTYDTNFREVITRCKKAPRKNQPGTWITKEMLEAYVNLHEHGIAHSVEVWQDNKLAGGLYGVYLGKIFFGESMFTQVSNASKVGFIDLVVRLREAGCTLVDCQVHTKHLESLGAEFMPRAAYLKMLKENTEQEMQFCWTKQ
jgi:leucyl/phenylalanyl-tRNA--protein transferase